MNNFRIFVDTFSLSGAITLLFFVLTFVGGIGWMMGRPGGKDICGTFGTALTTFVAGKGITHLENTDPRFPSSLPVAPSTVLLKETKTNKE